MTIATGLWWLLVGGCSLGPSAAEKAALSQVEGLVRSSHHDYRARMVRSVAPTSPDQAVRGCSVEPASLAEGPMTHEHRRDTRVGHTALRLRNPANVGPPWVQQWLLDHGQADPGSLETASFLASTPGGTVARAVVPMVMEPACMRCHGDEEDIPAELSHMLSARYPGDAGAGYALGELRGVLWAEVPVD